MHMMLGELIAKVRPARPPGASSDWNDRDRRNSSKDILLKCAASKGVSRVSLSKKPHNRSFLQIEDHKKMPLSPQLALLVTALIADDRPSRDSLVPWKSDADIIAYLNQHTAKRYNKRALNQLLYRLRVELHKHDENRWLIMRDAELGIRFALQRNRKIPAGNDHN